MSEKELKLDVHAVRSVAARARAQVEQYFADGKLALAALPEPARRGDTRAPRLRARVEGMLLGLAIGDSLGNTSESMTPGDRREEHGEIRDYLPNRNAAGQRVGLPSDDTQLAVWTLDSMLDEGRVDIEALARAFGRHQIFGIGRTMRRFFRARDQQAPGDSAWEARQTHEAASNGALMRIAAVVAPHAAFPGDALVWETILAAALTHDDQTSTASCVAFVQMLDELLAMSSPPLPSYYWERFVELARPLEGDRRLRSRVEGSTWEGSVCDLVASELPRAHRDGLSVLEAQRLWHSGAFLLETVPSVLYTLALHASDPEEAIVRAVNDTKDNDTIAAIVGAAVGALHGAEALPERWRAGLLGRTTGSDDGHLFETLARLRPHLGI